MRCIEEVLNYTYFLIPILFLFLIPWAVVRNRKLKTHYDDLYKKSYENQAEMIAVLREIRDALKK